MYFEDLKRTVEKIDLVDMNGCLTFSLTYLFRSPGPTSSTVLLSSPQNACLISFSLSLHDVSVALRVNYKPSDLIIANDRTHLIISKLSYQTCHLSSESQLLSSHGCLYTYSPLDPTHLRLVQSNPPLPLNFAKHTPALTNYVLIFLRKISHILPPTLALVTYSSHLHPSRSYLNIAS